MKHDHDKNKTERQQLNNNTTKVIVTLTYNAPYVKTINLNQRCGNN